MENMPQAAQTIINNAYTKPNVEALNQNSNQFELAMARLQREQQTPPESMFVPFNASL